MNILLEDNSIVDAIAVESFDDILKCERLFYELGEKIGLSERWHLSGKFREVKDVARFIDVDKHHQANGVKNNCSMYSYIKHHNFHVIFKD